MIYADAIQIAHRIRDTLSSECIRIEIAGSLRRKAENVRDIEIVAIPKPYETGLFESGIASIINRWPKIRGELPCKYTRREVSGIEIDLFFATPQNWGYLFAIRTGSASFSKRLAAGWVKNGYQGKDGMIVNRSGTPIPCYEEEDLFRIAGLRWISPEKRI